MKYGVGVFKESIVIDEDLHIEKCTQLLTQMSGCNILFNLNLWFKVEKIKTK
jgi:predicted amidohydrolase